MTPRCSSDLVLEITDEHGRGSGTLRVWTLPSSRSSIDVPPLLDLRGKELDDPGVEPVQLLEGREYFYEAAVHARSNGVLSTDRPEMFFPDPDRSDRGRLRTGLYTGTVRVAFYCDGSRVGHTAFEVRSTKLDYLRGYQWMLRDIAETAAELVMDRFGPSEREFAAEFTHDARTLYQRFAFLRSLLESEVFSAAIRQIIARPHVAWEEEERLMPPGRGGRPSSRLARSLVSAGPRVPWPHAPPLTSLVTLPHRMSIIRTESTLDNNPNRFVKFVLERWRLLVVDVGQALEEEPSSAPVERGRREVGALLGRLGAILSEELFREVGSLSYFPAGNQVLLKRDGYRHILQAYTQFELAARLAWPGMDEVYSAGQRDVARLYEYWVYLQLARTIARLCGDEFDARQLLQRRNDGLMLSLQTGTRLALRGTLERLGRKLHLELWFNRTFGTTVNSEGSWTRPLRPDCSLLIHPDVDGVAFDPVWLHFDAKYRIDDAVQLFGGGEDAQGERIDARGTDGTDWKREDLLKMHAYKDAIRRSVGAYIVYPGRDSGRPFREYHELLPGLGAFALCPTEAGIAEGSLGIAKFVSEVVDHVALQATQHERARFWQNLAYRSTRAVQARVPAAPFLHAPPADVPVLLGYAKSAEHRVWIARAKLYNLRADANRGGSVGVDGRELGAHLLALYGRDDSVAVDLYRIVGPACILTSEALVELDYPNPAGKHYLCLTLQRLPDGAKPSWLDAPVLRRARDRIAPTSLPGAPVVVTWEQLSSEMTA